MLLLQVLESDLIALLLLLERMDAQLQPVGLPLRAGCRLQ